MLVIIGLLVGGVLLGQDLIQAAQVRATITQLEKFNTATNTFYGKYGYLPGDIPAGPAAQFGFAPRGSYPGEGDGDGVLEGGSNYNYANGFNQMGEIVMFWVDLSAAGLIDGSFTTANATTNGNNGYTSPYASGSPIGLYLQDAKLDGGNYFYVFSGSYTDNSGASDSSNYFGLANVSSLGSGSCPPCLFSQPGLTVLQDSPSTRKSMTAFRRRAGSWPPS